MLAAMVDPTGAATNRRSVLRQSESRPGSGGAMTCVFTWLDAGQSDAPYFPGQPRVWRLVDGLDEGHMHPC